MFVSVRGNACPPFKPGRLCAPPPPPPPLKKLFRYNCYNWMISFGKEQQVTRTITKCRSFFLNIGKWVVRKWEEEEEKIFLLWPVCRHAVLGGTDGRSSGSFSFFISTCVCPLIELLLIQILTHTPTPTQRKPLAGITTTSRQKNKRDSQR